MERHIERITKSLNDKEAIIILHFLAFSWIFWAEISNQGVFGNFFCYDGMNVGSSPKSGRDSTQETNSGWTKKSLISFPISSLGIICKIINNRTVSQRHD
jgi:hypothetical protein